MKTLYTAVAVASGDGRNGHARSDDGILDVDVRVPGSMGGTGGATNPEQLFAAGYAACFHSALKLVARADGVNVDGTEITARVALGVDAEGTFGLAVELDVHAPHMDRATAQDMLERAHKVCPYSNATRGNIDVVLNVI